MLNILSFERFKRFLVIFSLCTFLLFSYNSYRVYANPAVVGAPIVVGEVTIGTGALVALAGSTLVAGGVLLDKTANDGSVCQYVGQKMIQGGNVAQYVGTKTIEGGQKVLTWTKEGLEWFKSTISSVKKDGIPSSSGTVAGTYNFSSTWHVDIHYTSGGLAGQTQRTSTFPSGSYTLRHGDQVMDVLTSTGSKIGGWGVDSPYHDDGTIVLDGGGSICAPVSKSFDTYTYNPDVIGSSSVASDGSISYSPTMGIPLTDSGTKTDTGSVIYNPTLDIPFGETWDTLKDKVAIPTSTVIPGDTTGTIDTGSGIFSIPILGDILKILQKILDFLLNLVKTLVDSLISALEKLLTKLFVPDADILSSELSKVESTIQSKFPTDFTLFTTLGNTSSSEPDFVYHFSLFGVYLTIDINFIKQIVPYSRMLANGLVAIFLVWYHFRKIIWIIRGSSPIVGDSHVGLSPTGSSDNLLGSSDIKRLN